MTNKRVEDDLTMSDKKPFDKLEPYFVKNDKIDSEDKNEAAQEEQVDSISFFKLYKYATTVDILCIIAGSLAAVCAALTQPANTYIFGSLVQTMVEKGSLLMSGMLTAEEMVSVGDAFMDDVILFAIYSAILGAIVLVGTYLSVMLFNYAAANQIFKIRKEFFKSAINQDIAWYDVNKSGEFASRMNEDLTKLEDGIGEKVVMFMNFVIAFIALFILALVQGWQLALVCMASLPVTFIVIGTIAVITGKLSKKELEAYAKAGAIADEVFSAIRTVMSFSGEEKESARYASNLVDARKLNIKKGWLSGLGFGGLWFAIYATYALSFWYGVGLVLDQASWPEDEIIYTPGVMFTVFMSVMMGASSLGASSPYIEAFGMAKGAAAKIFSIIEKKSNIDPLADKGVIPNHCIGNIEMKNVFFQYPSRPDVQVLNDINLFVKQGETVALVGSSGCGKSTCVQLFQRFYDPEKGSLHLDNLNIKDLNVNWLRQQIGVVGQEPVLFGTTIYENIRYGYESATQEEVEAAAKAANAHNFIQTLPQGYQTLVGERGAQMSGGQKQRIAIARALVRNPKILLLDEATSALDMASEAKVQAALEVARKGRTTIIVAHRLSTIRNCDKIVVLNQGKVVEVGDHTNLMKFKGHYFDLVTLQMGSVEKDGILQHQETGIIDTYDEDARQIDILKDEDESNEKNKAPPISIWKVIQWNRPEMKYIVIGSISSLIVGSAMPFFGIIFGNILGVLTGTDDDEVRRQSNMYSLYFVLIGILIGVATFIQISFYGIAGEYLTERIRSMAFNHILKQEVAWFDDRKNGTGTLCSRLSSDAAAIQGATGQRIGTVLSSISTIVLSVGIAMYYDWRLGFVALAFTPIIFAASFTEIRYRSQQNMGNAKALESSTKIAVEVVSNIRTVVALGREKMFNQLYVTLLEPSLVSAKKVTHVRALVFAIARSVWLFAYPVCMYYGATLVVQGEADIGTVFIVTQIMIMSGAAIAASLAFAPNFQKGMMSAANINQLLERESNVRDPLPDIGDLRRDSEKPSWEAYGSVNYYDAEFFYPTRPSVQVLQKLKMDISQGQTVALVGPSGCGKSTALQVLLRFYNLTNGYIAVDTKNITDVTLKQLRAQIGMVSQEPTLFDRTIAENIAYGDNSRDVGKEEIIEAAKQANIHNFVVSLPLGYETPLGDKGTQLSGGQKQRIAIARALIRKPKILLLDEATSALDMESEKVVQEALDKAREGRTCITIAHRLSTIVDADVIFVLDEGKVIEQGSHKELLALNGMYHKLYSLQTGGSGNK